MSIPAHGNEVSRGALWFGLFGGAIAWTVHLLLAYSAAEFGCVGGFGEPGYLGLSRVAWIELALTAATSLAAATATVVAYRSHRWLQGHGGGEDANGAERYVAWAGLLTSGLFTLIILFESIPILYYLKCC